MFLVSVRAPYAEVHEAGRLLSIANEELRAAHERLEQRVSERTHDLEQAKINADRANQAKTDFLSAMSHELRTPLNSILGFAQLLRTGRPGPLSEKQAGHLDHIIRGGTHLLSLISEVLDLSRIEAGKLTISLEPIDPAAILSECVAQSRVFAMRNRVIIADCQIDGDVRMQADQVRFKQVVLNLLSNAVKYNKPGGVVQVTAGPGGPGMVRVSVQDTGRGIAPDKQAQLFQPFNRLGAESSEIEGTGVGLTITKRLVEAMGGSIGFSSMPGQGAVFWFDIPRASHHPVPARTGPQGELRLMRRAAGGQAWKILYVEDNPANLFLMESLVADLGSVDLSSAHGGDVGLELAAGITPDLIVVDINMPGMDGIEMVRRLRARDNCADTPIIALSANAMPEIVTAALAAGFDRYLTKPLDVALFVDALNALLPQEAP